MPNRRPSPQAAGQPHDRRRRVVSRLAAIRQVLAHDAACSSPVSRSRAEVAAVSTAGLASRRGTGLGRNPAGAGPRRRQCPRQPVSHTIAAAVTGRQQRRPAAIRQVLAPRPAVRPCRVHRRCGLWPRRRDVRTV